MITDYDVYELSRSQRLRFEAAGYGFIALILFLFYRSLLLALLGGVMIRWFLPFYQKYLAGKRHRQLDLQFRDLLYSLSASITAGRQMEEALVEACDHLSGMYAPETPIMRELTHMKKSILENREDGRVLLSDFASRAHSEDISSFVQVYLTCRSTGGDLEKVIAHTSQIITDKMKINEEILTIVAQKKTEGRMISLMPAGMLLALNLMSPAYISILYSCLAGRLVMTFCLFAAAGGVWLMERMSHVEV